MADGLPLTCTVLEGTSHWGGKIETHHTEDLLIEAGPDSFLSQKPSAIELCGKLGLSDQLLNTNESDKKAFVYSKGRLRALPEGLVVIRPSNLGAFLRSGLFSPLGLARMALDLLVPARRSAEDESLGAFFRRRVGRQAFERLFEPLMAGIYAGDAEQMSLRATFPRFLEMEQRQGGLLRAMLAARKPQAPAPGSTTRTMFVTLRNGLGDLVDRLVAKIASGGVSLLLGQKVKALHVRTDAHGSHVYDLVLESERVVSADIVVFATPAYVTAGLVRSFSPSAANLLSLIPYASTATVSLAYDRGAVGTPMNGFGFVVPRVEGRTLLAATWTSRKWACRAPASKILVRCYLGGAGREGTIGGDDDMLVRVVRHELWSMAGVSAEPKHVEVNRWPMGMPQYTLGHLDRLDMIDSLLRHHQGLYLAGAGYRGVGIPDCIKDGTETARKIADSLVPRSS